MYSKRLKDIKTKGILKEANKLTEPHFKYAKHVTINAEYSNKLHV